MILLAVIFGGKLKAFCISILFITDLVWCHHQKKTAVHYEWLLPTRQFSVVEKLKEHRTDRFLREQF